MRDKKVDSGPRVEHLAQWFGTGVGGAKAVKNPEDHLRGVFTFGGDLNLGPILFQLKHNYRRQLRNKV